MKKYSYVNLIILVVMAIGVFGSGGVLAYDFGEFDLGGQTVTLFHYMNIEILEELKEEGRFLETEEEFNVKLRIVPARSSGEIGEDAMTRLLAGDATHDIWGMHSQFMNQLVQEGALYPVDEFLDETYYDEYLPLGTIQRAPVVHGVKYGFGGSFQKTVGTDGMRFWAYNPEIFEAEGLPDLQELYDRGEWTWDLARDIAIRATKDTTGDGEFDQLGISDSAGVHRQVDFLLVTNSGQLARWIDGKAVATIDEEPVIETIEFFRDLHERGVISWGRDRTGFLEGRYAMMSGIGGWYLPGLAQMEADYRIVPSPMGPSAEKHNVPMTVFPTVLPISSENPEAMVAIYHHLFPAEESERNTRNYFEGHVRDRRSFNILYDMIFKGTPEPRFIAGWPETCLYEISAPSFHEALTGEKSAEVAMAEQKPEIQAVLDDVLGQ